MDPRSATVVLNLPSRVDRRVAMQTQLSTIGCPAEFFPAIRPDSAGDFPSIGSRGCFLSHLSVLKRAVEKKIKRLVILEDDVNFSSNLSEDWKLTLTALEKVNWSIVYAGHTIDTLPLGLSRLPSEMGVRTTHFMVINYQAIPTLIEGLEDILSRCPGHQMGGPMHVDGAYSTIRAQNPSLITYAYFPPLGYQRPSRSDIGDLKWFDRIEFLKPLIDVGRRLKATRKG
jgi:GR25 family glycosyltransferase involved in LPS biosynthesis